MERSMDLTLLLLFVLLILTILLVAYLVRSLLQQSKTQTQFLLGLVKDREVLIQSLLNQLQSKDPYTLQTLQAVTSPTSYSTSNEYVPVDDQAEFARFGQGYGDELTNEDMAAFGTPWTGDNG